MLASLEAFGRDAERQIDQIRRRILQGETIPHDEKVFSLFQRHTEWLSKGKAGVPVERGLRVCILEDPHGFILYSQVMPKLTDDPVAAPKVKGAQQAFPNLTTCRYDQAFHSKSNQENVKGLLDTCRCPKKAGCRKPIKSANMRRNSLPSAGYLE